MALCNVSLGLAKKGISVRFLVNDESLLEGIPKKKKGAAGAGKKAEPEKAQPAFENVQSMSLKAFFASLSSLGFTLSRGTQYAEVRRKRCGRPGADPTYFTGYALSLFFKKNCDSAESAEIAEIAQRFFDDPWNCVGLYPNREIISIAATGRDMKVVPKNELRIEKGAIVLEAKKKMELFLDAELVA